MLRSLAECEALRAGATEEVKAEVIFAQVDSDTTSDVAPNETVT